MHGTRKPVTAPHETVASAIGALTITMHINATIHDTLKLAIVLLRN
jgi:hypothetical protein